MLAPHSSPCAKICCAITSFPTEWSRFISHFGGQGFSYCKFGRTCPLLAPVANEKSLLYALSTNFSRLYPVTGCSSVVHYRVPVVARSQILTVTATNLVDASQIAGDETDPSIAISPLNPSNMVIAAAIDSQPAGLLISTTTNMGANWTTNLIATNGDSQGLVAAYGEPSVAWDIYGNLFVAYLPDTLEGVAVALSTNGGATFGMLTNLAAQDSTDEPKITSPRWARVWGARGSCIRIIR